MAIGIERGVKTPSAELVFVARAVRVLAPLRDLSADGLQADLRTA
jgi:hypothetical protein